VEVSAPFIGEQKTAISGNLNWSALVASVTTEYFGARGWKLADGELFNVNHLTSASKTAVIGQTVVRELFRGGEVLGRSVRIERTSYTVIGVLEEKGQDFTGRDQDNVIFIPLSSARIFAVGRSQASPDAVHTVLVKVTSAESMSEVESSIAQLLRQRHKIFGRKIEDFRVQNLVQIVQTRDRTYRQFTLLVSTLAGVSLLVGGIGVMNIMLVSVAERTNEIGIRLAFGARPADIRRQFLFEAALLCTLGGLLGLALGYACARVVPPALGWSIEFNQTMALLSVICSSIIGVVFGFLPAERAARLDPAVLMRSAQ
jgi:putative ABC transport system permease protein